MDLILLLRQTLAGPLSIYLFKILKGSYRLQATSCKLMSGTPEASSLKHEAEKGQGILKGIARRSLGAVGLVAQVVRALH